MTPIALVIYVKAQCLAHSRFSETIGLFSSYSIPYLGQIVMLPDGDTFRQKGISSLDFFPDRLLVDFLGARLFPSAKPNTLTTDIFLGAWRGDRDTGWTFLGFTDSERQETQFFSRALGQQPTPPTGPLQEC